MAGRRREQVLLVSGVLWLSWLSMMLVHEAGHVLGAWASGGTVRRVVWHPAVLSRTDVDPNPRPLVEVWAGPIVGVLAPVVIAAVASAARAGVAYLFWVVAGFCLIANGAYIGLGALWPVGDARELLDHGAPPWTMLAFGVAASTAGFWTWHRVSPRLGSGVAPAPVNATHAYVTAVLALLATVLGFVLGNRGV